MTKPNEALGPDALDFWVGDWTLTWADGGRGTNRIERVADGRVILETFEGHSPSGSLHGVSLSVREGDSGPWRQTWADSSGGYLDLVGVEVDGCLAFERRTEMDGQRVIQRMVWLDRAPSGFRWRWQRSTDEGAMWTTGWEIQYRRP